MKRLVVVEVTEEVNLRGINKKIRQAFGDGVVSIKLRYAPKGKPRDTTPIGPPVSVRLPDEDNAALIRMMKKEGKEKAALIRTAVSEFVNREEKGEKSSELG